MYCVVASTAIFSPHLTTRQLTSFTTVSIPGFVSIELAQRAARGLTYSSGLIETRCVILDLGSENVMAHRFGSGEPRDHDRPSRDPVDKAIDDLQKSGDRYRDDPTGKNLKKAMDDYKRALDELSKP